MYDINAMNKVYNYLSDEISKEIYLNRINRIISSKNGISSNEKYICELIEKYVKIPRELSLYKLIES